MYGTKLNIKTIILYPQTEVLWKQVFECHLLSQILEKFSRFKI